MTFSIVTKLYSLNYDVIFLDGFFSGFNTLSSPFSQNPNRLFSVAKLPRGGLAFSEDLSGQVQIYLEINKAQVSAQTFPLAKAPSKT